MWSEAAKTLALDPVPYRYSMQPGRKRANEPPDQLI